MLGGPMLRRGWESFSSMIYAVYVMIPIVDFGQTEAWTPPPTVGIGAKPSSICVRPRFP